MINDIDYGLSAYIYEGHNNKLYTVLSSNDLLRHLNSIYENDRKLYNSKKMQKLHQLVAEMDENRNPVLMIATYK